MNITYKKIVTGVRPVRFAVFFNENDENWQVQINGILEWFSHLWGGCHNIIIPTDGDNIKPYFLKLLIEFDPDICCYYERTNLDELFEHDDSPLLEEYSKKIAAEYSFSMYDALNFISQNPSPINSIFEKVKYFSSSILSRLSCYKIANENRVLKIYKNVRQSFGAITTTSLRSHASELKDIIIKDFNLSDCAVNMQLALRSIVGKMNPLLLKEKISETVLEKISSNEAMEFLSDIYKGGRLTHTPFSFCNFGITTYTYGEWSESSIVVIGNSASDYALYFSLTKIMQAVFWVPKIDYFYEPFNTESYIYLSFVKLIDIQPFAETLTLQLTSCSSPLNDLQSLNEKIEELPFVAFKDKSIQITAIEPSLLNFQKELYVYEKSNGFNNTIQQFDNNISTNFIASPKSKLFERISLKDAGWIIDYRIEGITDDENKNGYILPNHEELICRLFNYEGNVNAAKRVLRKSRDGYSIRCPLQGVHFADTSVDEVTAYPILRLETDITIFKRIFKSHGYNVEISDKGKYTNYSVNLFESIQLLEHYLTDNGFREILECYNDPSDNDRRKAKGLQGTKVKSGVYLSYNHIKLLYKNDTCLTSLLDMCIEKSILTRGILLKCEQCDYAEWYNMDRLAKHFTCIRCDKKQTILSRHWLKGGEPTFFYRLNEMLHQGFKHNMTTVIHGINHLNSLAKSSFFYQPELNIISVLQPNKKVEIDIAAIVDGQIWLGEAKSNDEIDDEEIEKYLHLCNQIGAKFLLMTNSPISDSKQQSIIEKKWTLAPKLQAFNH